MERDVEMTVWMAPTGTHPIAAYGIRGTTVGLGKLDNGGESTDITNGYLETAIDWLPGVKEILLRFTKLLQNHRPT
ncbi:hypothetical protein JHK85_009837 [Glycine max]|nr:hypothetical protein JHK85_009837 [Glycine max]